MTSKISVVINAQNVEEVLPRVLSSVKDLADEIVVIDQSSTDKTAEVAKKFGAKVFNHENVAYVEIARNFAIAKASGDWILILDPDEEMSEKLAKKIKEVVKENKADYYRIPRKNIIFGKWIKNSRWWPDMNVRLFRKGFVSWNEVIHAVPITQGRGGDFEEKEEFAIIHHNYDSIEEYLTRMNRYTTQYAKMKIEEGYEFLWKDIIVKPMEEFLSRYFFGRGYKDGLHGLALSFLQAFSELSVYLKIWQNGKFVEEDTKLKDVVGLLRDQERNMHYWQSDSLFKEGGSFIDRIRRKLKI
jgi:(heptosyl)LPS beta-1,4-glucosyltransferase